MKKKVLNLMLLVSIMTALIIMLPLTVNAAYSGACGDNLTWTLDDEGTLTISGSGNMYDYYPPDRYAPWYTYNWKIYKIVIEKNVKSIGEYAFYECDNFASIEIPSSITKIGRYAFISCDKLKNISIPESVKNIGEGVFDYCVGLESIQVNEDNPAYTTENGVLFDKEKTTLIHYPSASKENSYVIPEGVTAIEKLAFEECAYLENISLPDSMKSIGERAFESSHLLETITIPKNVTTIGKDAFPACFSLSNIHVDEENSYYTSENGVLYDKAKTKLICYPQGKTETLYTVPNCVICLGSS